MPNIGSEMEVTMKRRIQFFKKSILALILSCIILTPNLPIVPDSITIIAQAAGYSAKTIQLVQTKLNDLGYDCGTPDGVAGSNTKASIKKYQREKKQKVTGTVNKALLKSLSITVNKTSASGTPKNTNKQSQTVYITKEGSKYHALGCHYLKKSKIALSLTEAKINYTPCFECNP